MIGQMILIGFRGLEVSEEHHIVQAIRQHHIGSVVFFDIDVQNKSHLRNIQSPQQVKALVNTLQAVSPTPLIISIDCEGGKVNRLKEQYGFPPTVSAQYLGTKDDLTLTKTHASSMARTLAALGINVNLAPVVDLNTNPDNPIIGKKERSFSADPDRTTKHALEFIKAHHEKGIFCTLKHFPGHGSSTEDSHLGMVDVTKSWSPSELEPYANIINAGQADIIMTAHVFNAHLDPTFPATLSKPIITGILRERLNFQGVVISDDMHMRAITNEYGFETAIQTAIHAGVDILSLANNSGYREDLAAHAVATIQRLLQDGKIQKHRIEESFRRIQRLKRKLIK